METPKEHLSEFKDEAEMLECVMRSVGLLPDGYERIGRGHIICHPAWYHARVHALDLSFTDTAKRYCTGKVKDAAVTVWNGKDAVSYTFEPTTTRERAEQLSTNLAKFFVGTPMEGQEFFFNVREN